MYTPIGPLIGPIASVHALGLSGMVYTLDTA